MVRLKAEVLNPRSVEKATTLSVGGMYGVLCLAAANACLENHLPFIIGLQGEVGQVDGNVVLAFLRGDLPAESLHVGGQLVRIVMDGTVQLLYGLLIQTVARRNVVVVAELVDGLQ